jgi:hypothetical protein
MQDVSAYMTRNCGYRRKKLNTQALGQTPQTGGLECYEDFLPTVSSGCNLCTIPNDSRNKEPKDEDVAFAWLRGFVRQYCSTDAEPVGSRRVGTPAYLGQALPIFIVLIRLLATIFRVKRNTLLIFENIHPHALVSEHLLVARGIGDVSVRVMVLPI